MMSEKEVSERLTRAVMADMSENPTLFKELAAGGPDSITNALNQDVLTALRGDPGQSLFPHLRGTMRDIIGLAKSEIWADTGKYLGQAATGGDSTLNFIGNLFNGLTTIGTTIYQGIVAKDVATIQANALKAQQEAAARAAMAQQQTAAQQQGGLSTASMFGGGMGTLLLIGAAGAVIYVISTQIGKGGGRKRR